MSVVPTERWNPQHFPFTCPAYGSRDGKETYIHIYIHIYMWRLDIYASAASQVASPSRVCSYRDFLNGFRKSRPQHARVVCHSVWSLPFCVRLFPFASAASQVASPTRVCSYRDFLNGFRKSRLQPLCVKSALLPSFVSIRLCGKPSSVAK